MKNPSLSISLNGKLLSVAQSDQKLGGVSAIITNIIDVNEELNLSINVCGRDFNTDELLIWLDQDLSIGDSITIQITNDSPTVPVRLGGFSQPSELENKMALYKRLQEELKDHL
jgi:hypothetical protein